MADNREFSADERKQHFCGHRNWSFRVVLSASQQIIARRKWRAVIYWETDNLLQRKDSNE